MQREIEEWKEQVALERAMKEATAELRKVAAEEEALKRSSGMLEKRRRRFQEGGNVVPG